MTPIWMQSLTFIDFEQVCSSRSWKIRMRDLGATVLPIVKKKSAIYTKITLVLEIIKYLHLFSRINGEIVQFSIVLGSNKV